LFGEASVQAAGGVVNGNRGIHDFEHTWISWRSCGKEIHERPGAPEDYRTLRERSIVDYHSAGSVVNRQITSGVLSEQLSSPEYQLGVSVVNSRVEIIGHTRNLSGF
jgi:hypothetical protein